MPQPTTFDLATQTQRMVDAMRSLAHFCRVVLGYHDMMEPHEELCQFLQQPGPLKLVLAPRYSFKSCMATIGYSLFRLVHDPNLRILIYSDTNEKAEGFLEEIKNHLLGRKERSTFRQLFGGWDVDAKHGVWNQSAITVKPRTSAEKEPSIDTAGIETSKVGLHYDLIIFDDIVTEKNITTPELMQKVIQVFQKAHSLLKPDGDIVVVGTRWHFGDLYGLLLADRVKFPRLQVYKTSGEGTPERPYPYAAVPNARLTKEKLAELKGILGSDVYSAIIQNEPTDEATALFKAQDLRFYTERPTGLYVTAALDPIPPRDSPTGDDAALVIVGVDAEHTWYLLDLIAGRLQPSEQIDALFRLHQRWGIRALAVETNHWQRTLLHDIELRVAQERKRNPAFRFFHVEPITRAATTSKHQDIRGLQPYVERHAILWPGTRLELLEGDWKKLALQMLQYPNAQHDDLVDALSMHLHVTHAGDAPIPTKTFPWSSAGWFEREQRKLHAVQNAQQPRWARTPLPPYVWQ